MDIIKKRGFTISIFTICAFVAIVFMSSAMSSRERITIYMIGDSTMAEKDTVGNPERGWGQALSLYFDTSQVRIENQARNGRSTKSFLDEGLWRTVIGKLKKGDYVIIEFGHNDEKSDHPELYADAWGSYTANLARYVKESRSKGAHPILMTPIVRRHFDATGRLVNTHGEYPEAVRTLAKEMKVPLIDMEEKSREMVERLGPEDSKRLFVWFGAGEYPRFPEGKRDDTHLKWEGAVSIAGMAAEGIREQRLPISRYLKAESSVKMFGYKRATLIYAEQKEKEVVRTAIGLLGKDVEEVFGGELEMTGEKEKAQIVVSDLSEKEGGWETFCLDTEEKRGKKQLIVRGSDARGKAYGLLEISRMMGVSPWKYFADVKVEKRDMMLYPEKRFQASPSVRYRGIFLNDEDWCLLPWATKTQKSGRPTIEGIDREKGAIGPATYEKIFELLLRLRANTIWPAMHECTVPFYYVKGNREMADKYGIVVGTSHCEPMLRNSASEWDISGKGAYNFLTNRGNVLQYWAERLKEVKESENLFTIGMRGKHDGPMEGVKNTEEYRKALSEVIPAQEELLKKYINPHPEKASQVFTPYKEVLDVYDSGLQVPDYVTLVWCDDNYGYIHRLSNQEEQKREGRSGVYYHISYWGRPHDYLWLASTSPALMYTEMRRAYENGADRLWMLNVGDIKPGEYLMEFFLDLAWNIHLCEKDRSVFGHLERWAGREFGRENANDITKVMREYYRLGTIRKPEFMGWSRVEEEGYGKGGITPVRDTEYNPDFHNELNRRIEDYRAIEESASKMASQILDKRKDAFFQMVTYPVKGASAMNRKWLSAQLAHYYTFKDIEKAGFYARESEKAYEEIEKITKRYNEMEDGKWRYMMNFRPRNLPVFDKPSFKELDSLREIGYQPVPMLKTEGEEPFAIGRNASQAEGADEQGEIVEGLGHSFSAVKMKEGASLSYIFDLPEGGNYWIKIGTLPNHDVDRKGMKIKVWIDGEEAGEYDYRTEGRSEQWKENVLRGQAITCIEHCFSQGGKVRVTVKAVTPYIILDQIMIGKGPQNFYEFPVTIAR